MGVARFTRLKTFRALTLCAVCTLLSFGLLAFCSTPVMRGIGSCVAIGVSCAFLFALMMVRSRPCGRTGEAA